LNLLVKILKDQNLLLFLIFYAKNLEVTKLIVIFENEHDKNQTKWQKWDGFEYGK